MKNTLAFTPYRLTESTDKTFEVTAIKIQTNKSHLTIIGLYRSPSGNEESFLSKLEKLLSELTKKRQSYIVIGDYNIDVLDVNSPMTRRLADLLRSFDLSWSINSPTRVTDHSATAIDNVVTNLTNVRVSVINTAISDHYGQEVTIFGHEVKRDPINKTTIRDTRPANIMLLNYLLSRESWSFLNLGDPVEQQFIKFEETFNFHLNVSCPLKTIRQKIKSQKCKWITKGILVSREKLLFFSEIKKHTINEEFKIFFRNYKRIYRNVIRAAKAYEVTKALLTTKNVSKTAWAIINNKSSPNNKKIELKIVNEHVKDPLKVANEFNTFFASVGADQGLCPLQGRLLSTSTPSPTASMALGSVTGEEIARVIRNFPSKKSNDSNYMSTWLIKQCSKHLLTPLEHLINLSFHSGTVPSSLKTAKVTPIFKKGDPLSSQNYRPISILPTFSKFFEKVFFTRMTRFLQKHSLLSINQFGFRSGKSTIDAVARLVEMIVEGIEGRKPTLSVFLDLSKAFDSVDHRTLFHKLEHYGVRGLPLAWLKSYLSNRKQFVGVSDVRSEERGLSYGVPQGSILSPLLFLIYVNDVGSSVQHGRLVQYADDTTLCFNAKSIKELEKITFMELNCSIQHFNELNLKTNPNKSSFMQFSLRHTEPCHSSTVMLNETEIEEVYATKFLGIHLDRGLTWDCHIDNVCFKISSVIFVMRQLSKYCPTQVLMTAYYGLIYPHLSYGLALWGGCKKENFSRMFILQKKAVRIIAKLPWRESCKPAFKRLRLMTLPCLYIFETCIFFKEKCDFVRGSDIHSYETRGRESYRTGRHRTVAHERLPSQAGVQFVNKLPNSIKSAAMPKVFKTRLRQVLVAEAFYNTDEFMAHVWETE